MVKGANSAPFFLLAEGVEYLVLNFLIIGIIMNFSTKIRIYQ
jgi:hypothetical protein